MTASACSSWSLVITSTVEGMMQIPPSPGHEWEQERAFLLPCRQPANVSPHVGGSNRAGCPPMDAQSSSRSSSNGRAAQVHPTATSPIGVLPRPAERVEQCEASSGNDVVDLDVGGDVRQHAEEVPRGALLGAVRLAGQLGLGVEVTEVGDQHGVGQLESQGQSSLHGLSPCDCVMRDFVMC